MEKLDTRKRDPPISVRATAAQRDEITARAKVAELSINAFMLAAALSGAKVAPRRSRHHAETAALLRQVLAELGRIGGNVNQQTRLAHQFGNPVASSGWQTVGDEINAAIADIRCALGHKVTLGQPDDN